MAINSANGYPLVRMRRLRENPLVRDMVRETRLTMDQMIYPMFVHYSDTSFKKEIASMPGQFQLSTDLMLRELERLVKLGLKSVILFGIPAEKDLQGSGAYDENGVVQKAIRAIKAEKLPLVVMADVCLCEYTSHGHCGIVHHHHIENDSTVELLARSAVSMAAAGADVVAPSDMMDGRVSAIRRALDQNGFQDTVLMSYAAKYASAFYGPFRDAAESTPAFGDRRSHQMDPANVLEAIRETELDILEGADIVMVKPALAYLDVIYRIKERTGLPMAAYAVSGEYSMIEAAARNGWIDRDRTIYESLIALRRAGSDMILSYHAPRVAELMAEGKWPL